MKDSVPPELNLANLRDLFRHMDGIESFIFFGTLLGFARDGDIIPHDDDIDIYVNRQDFSALKDRLAKTGFKIRTKPNARWYRPGAPVHVVQASRVQDGIETFADFYLYEKMAEGYLLERWNFNGKWRNQKAHLHVPTDLIFPLRPAQMKGVDVMIPQEPEAVCAFLYGSRWQEPVRKGGGYTMEIFENKPKITYHS